MSFDGKVKKEESNDLDVVSLLTDSTETDKMIIDRLESKVDLLLLKEALSAKYAYNAMPTKVKAGSEWYLISASWVKKWLKYTYFDCIDNDTDISKEGREHPGKIDCSDFVEPVTPIVLQEPPNSTHKEIKW